MKSQSIRVGLESWNFCNEVGQEAPNMGSPRAADCADLYCPLITGISHYSGNPCYCGNPTVGCFYGLHLLAHFILH